MTDDAPKLLSGGNPQIPKGYGEAPVQAYIAAMPGWKRPVGERLDALITEAVQNVSKAVNWNSPLYGMSQGVWFLGLHAMTIPQNRLLQRRRPFATAAGPLNPG